MPRNPDCRPFFAVLVEDDEALRELLPKHYTECLVLWLHLQRLAFRQQSPAVIARLGLLAYLTGIPKRSLARRLDDLSGIGFLAIESRRCAEGSVYRLLRGRFAQDTERVKEVGPPPVDRKDAGPLDVLRSTGRFPNLTAEALALLDRRYPGELRRHVEEVAARAASYAGGVIGDPMAWLSKRLREFRSEKPKAGGGYHSEGISDPDPRSRATWRKRPVAQEVEAR
jgi:hypothetical protein